TYLGTNYNSYIDDTNNIAYVQYLGDISSNVQMQMGNALASSAPSDPSAVSAAYNSDTQITVTWTDNASDEDNFVIQRRDDIGAGWGSYAEIGTVAANTTSFVDNSTNNAGNPPSTNERYQYKVIAQNIAGNSTEVATASATDTKPSAPTIGTPTVDSSTAITWTWTDNANFEDSYRLDYESIAGTDVDDLAADSESYQATGLTPNTAYSVSVKAYHNSRGESTSSASSATVYTLANAATSLTSASQTNTSITASWNANSNPNGTEYYIENMTASTNSGWTTDSSWSSASLTCGTEYTFRVKARNGSTISTAWTDNVTIATGACTANTNGGGGGVVALPPATGFGQVSANIAMGQNSNIGDINNTGTNVLAYINSSASFQATVSNHDNETTQEHHFKIIDLDLLNNIITLQINSAPQIVKLNLAESKTIDLDNDGMKDLEIKFANLYVNRAELTMSSILNEPTISKLIKYSNSPKVYLLENNKKRWIVDGEIFNTLGYKWNDIQIISDETIYTDGENLSSSTNKYIFKNFLKLGSLGEEIRQLQTKLKSLGYFNYPQITGYFGTVTEVAIKAFQKANNIDQFGYVGPATRAALNK
ncbi:peptidoglycan-binding protein, partial [Patescibacteria group bacterium]|nr:peptidoglycan-binding protein [Patescibacteria group bacterium]